MLEKTELKEIYAGAVDFAVVGMVIAAVIFLFGVVDGYLNGNNVDEGGSHAF